MLRIYSNENFPVEVVQGLRELGYDILTTHDAGRSGQRIPDEEVLAFAIAEKRTLLTINRKDLKGCIEQILLISELSFVLKTLTLTPLSSR